MEIHFVLDTNIIVNLQKNKDKFFLFYLEFFSKFVQKKHKLICSKLIMDEYDAKLKEITDKNKSYPNFALSFYLLLMKNKKQKLEEGCKKEIDFILENKIEFSDDNDRKFIYVALRTKDKIIVSADSDFGCHFVCENNNCDFVSPAIMCADIESCQAKFDKSINSTKNQNSRIKINDWLGIRCYTIIEALELIKNSSKNYFVYNEPKHKKIIADLKKVCNS